MFRDLLMSITNIALVVDSFFSGNRLFDIKNAVVNWDNINYQQYYLKLMLQDCSVNLSTYDLVSDLHFEKVIFYNYHKIEPSTFDKQRYLFIWEPEVVQPELYDKNYHANFSKVFTFCDELVDNKKYFKINYSYLIPTTIQKDLSQKQKLCTLIAGNKMVSHPLELYSKRVEAIRWFEQNHLEEFDLYGRGWSIPSNKVLRKIYDKSSLFRKYILRILSKPYPSYCGEIEEKIPVLQKYKFAICYENAKDISGYITEKMFHCFFAGCVPIYWGADNITNYVPANCFIDKRNFATYEALYDYISKIPNEEYSRYLENIETYLNSEQVQQFSAQYFADSVVKEILN